MRTTATNAIVSVLAIICFAMLPATAQGKGNAKAFQGELPIRQPWLRDHLPDAAVIYFRVPHMLGMLATPKASSMDAALKTTANVEILNKIKKAIADNVLEQMPLFADLRIRLFEKHLRSPVEVAAFMTPAPSALIAFNVDISSNDALYKVFELFALIGPNFTLAGPLDADGIGEIGGTGVPLFLKFDAASGRVMLNGGPAVTQESFKMLVAAVATGNNHRMKLMEQDIDDSGQGFFFWVDAEQAMPAMQTFMQPEQVAELYAMGMNKVRAAAIGWGVANGKGRLAIVVDVPGENNRDFLPYVQNDISARSVGNPDALLLLSVPTATEFSRIEALLLESASVESRTEWVQGKASFREAAGVSIEDLLASVGPEAMVIFDAAGDYAAFRVRDRKLWDDMLSHLSGKTGAKPDEKRIAGKTYFHWSLPGRFDWIDDASTSDVGWLPTLLQRSRDHIYWTIDGEFLYAASVPQILIERASKGAKTDVGEWLANSQRIDAKHAVLSMTGTNKKLPKRLYALYIEALQFLADIARTEIDVWSMPTAAQLKLPANGAVGLTVKFGDPNLAVELMFENNPFEALLSGGGSYLVVAGILAAVAIPAYQDYTIRARVSEGLNLSAPTKAAISEYYGSTGRFPGEAEASLMSTGEDAGQYVQAIFVEPDTGIIIIVYAQDAVPEGGELYLEPGVDANGAVFWNCSANIANKHLPAACRE